MVATHITTLGIALLIGEANVERSTSRPASTSQPATATQPADGPTLTIMTFNINYANRDIDQLIHLIQQSEADVVCLQETNRSIERALSVKLRRQYPHSAFRGDKGHYAAERFGFLSRLPLTDVRYLPRQDGIFGTWSAQIHFDGRPVQLVNVHLEPLRLTEARGWRETWRIYRSAEEIHQREMERIHEWMLKDTPTIVAGDFNSLSTFAAPAFLRAKGYTDSFAAVIDNADTHPTWKWELPSRTLKARIDYIFHCPHFQTTGSQIIEEDKSDHDPLITTLSWAESTDVSTSRPAETAP